MTFYSPWHSLGATIAVDWQFTDGVLRSLADLTIKSLFDGRFALLALGRMPSLTGLAGFFGNLFRRFLATGNGDRIPAYVPDKLFCKVLFYQCIVDPVSKTTGGKFGKGPREGRL